MQVPGILGIKKTQTQKFREDGKRIPVTQIEVNGNPVVCIKTMEKDGYWALQLGYQTAKHPSKPQIGHAKKGALDKAPQFLKEIRLFGEVTQDKLPKVGDIISLDQVLKPGDVIDVTGVSKGKGFAGGVKRYHFKGGPRTHGQSDRERAPGSIGQTTTPGRVYKGKRMAGKMGHETVTMKNLTVADIEGNTLYIEGLVPGAPGWLLHIKARGLEDKKFSPLLKQGGKKADETKEEAPIVEQPSEEQVPTEEIIDSEAKQTEEQKKEEK